MTIKSLLTLWIAIYGIYFYIKTKNGLHMLQLESYKNERYFKWIKNNFKKVINLKEVFLIILCLILIFINKEFL